MALYFCRSSQELAFILFSVFHHHDIGMAVYFCHSTQELVSILFNVLHRDIRMTVCFCHNKPGWLLGAVFVRRGKDGKAELVLLDHGLYDRLKPHERKALCQLYKAIIMLQEEDMEKYSKDLGVEGEALGTLSLSLPI